jgi:hypothetical protein
MRCEYAILHCEHVDMIHALWNYALLQSALMQYDFGNLIYAVYPIVIITRLSIAPNYDARAILCSTISAT